MSVSRIRPHKVTVRLSPKELSIIKKKAQKANLTSASFLRELGLKNKVAEPAFTEEERKTIIRQLQGIGNNINQLTKLAHQRKISFPALGKQLEKNKEVLVKIWQLLCAEIQKTQPG